MKLDVDELAMSIAASLNVSLDKVYEALDSLNKDFSETEAAFSTPEERSKAISDVLRVMNNNTWRPILQRRDWD